MCCYRLDRERITAWLGAGGMDATRAHRKLRNAGCVHRYHQLPDTGLRRSVLLSNWDEIIATFSPCDPLSKECQATEEGGNFSGPSDVKHLEGFFGTRHLSWPEENPKISPLTSTTPRLSSPRGGRSVCNLYSHPLNKHSPSTAICHTQCHRHPASNTC